MKYVVIRKGSVDNWRQYPINAIFSSYCKPFIDQIPIPHPRYCYSC